MVWPVAALGPHGHAPTFLGVAPGRGGATPHVLDPLGVGVAGARLGSGPNASSGAHWRRMVARARAFLRATFALLGAGTPAAPLRVHRIRTRAAALSTEGELGPSRVVELPAPAMVVAGVRRAATAPALVRAQEGLVLGMPLGVMHNGAASRIDVAQGHVVGSESSSAHARERDKDAERKRERFHGAMGNGERS